MKEKNYCNNMNKSTAELLADQLIKEKFDIHNLN